MLLPAIPVLLPLVHPDEKNGLMKILVIRPEGQHQNIQAIETLWQMALIHHECLTLLWDE